MATFTASYPLDFRNLDLYGFYQSATFSNQTSTSFRATVNSSFYVDLTGQGYQYNGNPYPVSGTTNDAKVFINGSLAYDINDLTITQSQAFAYMSQNAETVKASIFSGNDTILGSAYSDFINGYGGSNFIDGQGGDNTVILNFASSQARVSYDQSNHIIVDGPNNTHDVLANIAHLQFSDVTINNKSGTSAGANFSNSFGGHDLLLHSDVDGSFVFGEVANGSASFTKAGGFGSEWSFVGSGDFLGNGHTDFLLHSNSGALAVGEINNGQASFTQVGGLGSEWQFSGSGNYNGTGAQDLLLHNGQDGRLVVASIVNGSASYQQIGAIGSEWDFGGQEDASGASLNPARLTGDFLSDGHQGFLLHNTATGQIVVGEDINGTAQFTQVGSVGNEWSFLAAGNLLGNGHQDVLLHSMADGSLVVGEVANGQLNYTKLGGIGSDWQATGSGDYLNDGHTGVLLHNTTTGALVVAEMVNAQATFTQVSSVGNEWHILA